MKNLKTDFGAIGDGAADDTAPVQNWLDAGNGAEALYAPAGHYRVIGQRVRSGVPVSLYGDGRGLTVFEMEGATGGIKIAPGSVGRPVVLRDFTIVSKAGSQGDGLAVEWPSGGSSVYYHQATIRNIEIVPAFTSGAYFHKAIHITNGWNLALDHIFASGSPADPLAMESAIYFDGGGADNTISDAHLAFAFHGVDVDPAGVSEGLRVLESTMLTVGWGVRAVTITGSGTQTRVRDCHINAYYGGVHFDQRPQSHVGGNLIYKHPSSISNFLGIYFVRSHDGLILANQIIRAGADNADNGIVVSESRRVQVAHNLPTGMDTGIWLQGDSNNCQVVDNQGDSNGQMVADQGLNNLVRDNRQ